MLTVASFVYVICQRKLAGAYKRVGTKLPFKVLGELIK